MVRAGVSVDGCYPLCIGMNHGPRLGWPKLSDEGWREKFDPQRAREKWKDA